MLEKSQAADFFRRVQSIDVFVWGSALLRSSDLKRKISLRCCVLTIKSHIKDRSEGEINSLRVLDLNVLKVGPCEEADVVTLVMPLGDS